MRVMPVTPFFDDLQKLAEDDGAYVNNSAWANPKALKGHFSGVSQIRMPF